MAQSQIMRWIVRHGNLAKAVAITTGILIMLFTITLPFFNNTREMSAKITVKRKESQELADKVSVLSSLDEQVLTDRVQILDRALPPKKDVVLYLSTIDGLSRELNLNFGGISLAPGEVTEATGSASVKKAVAPMVGGLQSLETDIDITGSRESIYAFLRLLEESAPLMAITDVKVSGTTEDRYALSLRLGMLYAITDTKQVKGAITLFDEKEEAYFQQLDKFRRFEPLSDLAIQDTTLGKSNLFESFTPQQ